MSDPHWDRPPAAGLALHVYDRPLDPAFAGPLRTRTLTRGDATLTLALTPAGHVLSFESPGASFAECLCGPADAPPDGRVLSRPLGGAQTHSPLVRGGVRFRASVELEFLPEEAYPVVHDEIEAEGRKRGLLVRSPASARVRLAPLGLLTHDWTRGRVSVTGFYTFPDEWAVVKTQTLIETTA